LEGDEASAAEVVDAIINTTAPLAEVYLQVLSPAMAQVGDLWCDGKVNVAQEHLATQITLKQMERLRLRHPVWRSSRHLMLLACVEGEQHYLGALMVADLFRTEGWRVDFLGPDVPTRSLVEMVETRRPQLLALSVALKEGVPYARGVINEVGKLAVRPPILLGGQAVINNQLVASDSSKWLIAQDAIAGLNLARDLMRVDRPTAVLHSFLKELGRRIRELRVKAGWTQQQLAVATRLTRAYLVAVEGGKQNVTIDVVIRVANALGVSPERLLASDDDGEVMK
jgi:MerR family transcriptional regulator, light-induced transcriptional regulator